MAGAVPKNVSPLIRAGRWSLLLAGVMYGHSHHKTVQERENKVRQAEIDRVTNEAIEKVADLKVRADQSMVDLAKAAGVPVKESATPALAVPHHSPKSSSSKHH